ncbi:zona pellucida sperm-binding protein 3-like [Falco rusticolus]|uniref:zona pellucida sperm-binding protein 3-like n=1 Tax=Falco rusticolus TaxID=120794 RepID=UPI0018867373|nr:zona pellucida sperm-binding protein 3-like [Falco rusticolus]XP_055571907.1 zona pellucida sperm-binding protein 3-like [Falco cherrug]XP_055674389.1 zona pellucida sperm-binding protein 3-like [Falco peregrinus]
MKSGSSLGFALFCWVFGEVVSYNPWGFFRGEAELWRYGGDLSLGQPRAFSQPWAWVDVSQLQAVAPLHPVAVQCQEAQVVVTVHRDLFGTGRLVRAVELTLGSAGCLPVAPSAAEGTVTFVAGLHECGSTLKVTPDALVYSTSLNYNPVSAGNPVIIRTSPAMVPIECHYPRRDNVSSYGVKPTWAPFHSTLSSEEKLSFSLHLMNDDWSAERVSTIFRLGEVLHFQAGVNTENHAPLRLFVDNCVATLTPDRSSSPQYAFIDFSGCLVDGQLDDVTSTFISPRPRQDVLQFAVDAFKFAGDSRNLIYITCHMKVSLADQAPDPLNKACSFNKASSLWTPVEGTRDVCSCCELRSCGSARHSRRLYAPSQWQGGRVRRELPSQLDSVMKEADVVVGPLFIHSWQDHPVRRKPSPGHLWMVLGLAAVAGLAILIIGVLGALAVCWKASNPV